MQIIRRLLLLFIYIYTYLFSLSLSLIPFSLARVYSRRTLSQGQSHTPGACSPRSNNKKVIGILFSSTSKIPPLHPLYTLCRCVYLFFSGRARSRSPADFSFLFFFQVDREHILYPFSFTLLLYSFVFFVGLIFFLVLILTALHLRF